MSKILRRASIAVATLLVVAAASGVPASARPFATAGIPTPPRAGQRHSPLWNYVTSVYVPNTADCVAQFNFPCYQPFQLQKAYDLNPLINQNLNGAGETIAVVDSFGSPTIARDLAQFDSDFGLPDPPLKIIHPAGAIPPYRPSGERIDWAFETTLDVEWAHAFAPGARILVVEAPVNETQGLQGIPQIMKAENYVINHNMADVISQSFGTSEADFPSPTKLRSLRSAFKNARAHHVTMLASSGDTGATGYNMASQLFTHAAPQWPASDPLVTSVGGTQLHLNASGGRNKPDSVWNDTFNRFVEGRPPVPAAGGGGLSSVFARPVYQGAIHGFSADRRAYPDVSLSAAVAGGVLVYLSFAGLGSGYYVVGGTSEASPEFAGIVAIADQAAGHDLGFLDPALYQLHQMRSPALIDITKGNNLVRFRQNGTIHTVKGFTAKTGFDMASGLGTVDGRLLVQALAGP
jgi:subtilase family serine protease